MDVLDPNGPGPPGPSWAALGHMGVLIHRLVRITLVQDS